MKLALATAVLVGSATAFGTNPSFVGRTSALKMSTATETPTYTFTKSEEIFEEAQTVRLVCLLCFSETNPPNVAMFISRNS